jgi:hypothetical protein
MTARIVDLVGAALLVLYVLLLAGLVAALFLGSAEAAVRFTFGLIGDGATILALGYYEGRTGG